MTGVQTCALPIYCDQQFKLTNTVISGDECGNGADWICAFHVYVLSGLMYVHMSTITLRVCVIYCSSCYYSEWADEGLKLESYLQRFSPDTDKSMSNVSDCHEEK